MEDAFHLQEMINQNRNIMGYGSAIYQYTQFTQQNFQDRHGSRIPVD